jgi:hypothetical protein
MVADDMDALGQQIAVGVVGKAGGASPSDTLCSLAGMRPFKSRTTRVDLLPGFNDGLDPYPYAPRR